MNKTDFYINTPMGVSFEKFQMMADRFNIKLDSEIDYRCMVVSEHQMDDIYYIVHTEDLLPTLYFIRGKGRVSKEDFDKWFKKAVEVRDTLFLTLNQIQQESEFEDCDRFRLTNVATDEVISEGDALVPHGRYMIGFGGDGLGPEEWIEAETILVDAKGGWQFDDNTYYEFRGMPSLWQRFKNFFVG